MSYKHEFGEGVELKLKTRLMITFVTVIIIPVALSIVVWMAFSKYQLSTIRQNYGVSDTTFETIFNPVTLMNKIMEEPYLELSELAKKQPGELLDEAYLDEINQELKARAAFLIIIKEDKLFYSGTNVAERLHEKLPEYSDYATGYEDGFYIGGNVKAYVKQIDFQSPDGEQCSLFMVMNMLSLMPEMEALIKDVVIAIILILIFTSALLIFWIHRSVVMPLAQMQIATQNIKEGNLDYELSVEIDDELGQLCRDFEEMRIRLKDTAEETVKNDRRNKELISNISHDLKTPITTIKGYVEGIMDGVADTPEKMERYIRTIYNKANEMDKLIDELTLYSRIDSNRIPYNFRQISVKAYFDDCAEDLSIEMGNRDVGFLYDNDVEGDVKFVVDEEQLKRVINNIISNAVKYMDKERKEVILSIIDIGDYIQVNLTDNGKGIRKEELPRIFERFYRTDASRNSSTGGSGIGLAIAEKIIEEHGGRIWATSEESVGTTISFTIKKCQEDCKDE